MPEIFENGLLGGEHVVFLLVLKAPTQDSFLHAIIASLWCHRQGTMALNSPSTAPWRGFEYCLSTTHSILSE
jgi:hypothetical protein